MRRIVRRMSYVVCRTYHDVPVWYTTMLCMVLVKENIFPMVVLDNVTLPNQGTGGYGGMVVWWYGGMMVWWYDGMMV
jgi:hypothetical protein